jgi:hypothetical protein
MAVNVTLALLLFINLFTNFTYKVFFNKSFKIELKTKMKRTHQKNITGAIKIKNGVNGHNVLLNSNLTSSGIDQEFTDVNKIISLLIFLTLR